MMFRTHTRRLALALAVGVLITTRPTPADDPSGNGKPKVVSPAGPKPPTVKVEKGPLTASVTVKGVVEAERTAELAVRLKAWMGPLQVKKAVEHGAAVKAGEVLVAFDPAKIDLALRDARQERDLAALAIKLAESELPVLEKQTALDLAAAKRDHERAAEDLTRFLETDAPLAAQSAEVQVKSANFNLEYARDELKQLQKMYKDKDLTEETEEMILKRYKNSVEMAEFAVKRAKVFGDQTLKVDLPRREQAAREAVAKAEVALVKARDVLPLALNQKRLTLDKLRYEEGKAGERLADLEKDRAALTVTAPTDGQAYYGRQVRGQWVVPAGSQGQKLRGGGPVDSGEVFLTVVAPDAIVVRAEVEEKDLAGLAAGQVAKVTPTAFPDKRLSGKLAKLAGAPMGGTFEAQIGLDGVPAGLRFVPGMACSVRILSGRKEEALTVPASAVFADDEDGKYVYRPGRSGKPEKRTVKVGMTAGDRVEILDGLAEGDEILSAKP